MEITTGPAPQRRVSGVATAVAAVIAAIALVFGATSTAAAVPVAPTTPLSTEVTTVPVVTLGVGSQRIDVRWTAAVAPSAVVAQRVQIGWSGVPWTDVSGALGPEVRGFSVAGLTNGTRYAVRVLASTATETLRSTTALATPLGPPSVPRAVDLGVGATSVTLRWTAPSSSGGAPISRFVVHRSSDGLTWTAVSSSVPADSTRLRVDGLRPGVRIHLRIQAVAPGGRSAWVAVHGVPRSVPGAVHAATATAGSGQIRVYWGQPASNGASIQQYVVQRLVSGTWRNVATVGASARSITPEGMVNGVSQSFRVRAVNAVGAGAWSATSRTAPRAPSGCDARYGQMGSGSCVPIASDVDCGGGRGNGPAYFWGPGYVLTSDPYGLDSDGDRIACE